MNDDIEIWKPILIGEVLGLYEVSNLGKIKSLPRLKHTPHNTMYLSSEKILKQSRTNSGYLSVTLSNKPFNKSFFVHILGAIAHVENPFGHEFVNHDDGNKLNNYSNNFTWMTRSQNMIHAFAMGLIPNKRNKKAS